MRFKLEKRCSKLFIKKVVSFFFVLGLFAKAHATIYISPANGGSASGETSQGGNIYYVGYFDVNVPRITSPAMVRFNALNLSTDIVRVNFRSDIQLNLTGSQKAVITFFAYPNSSTAHQAPFAEVNNVACSSTNPNCVAYNWPNGFASTAPGGQYFGAIYPASGAVITIGFRLSDICLYANRLGTQLDMNVCNGDSLNTTPNGNPLWNFHLAFALVVSADGNQGTYPSTPPQTLDSMSSFVNLSFQSTASTFTCPDTNTLNSNYFPGENSILLNTSLFGITPPNGGGAPMGSLIVVGRKDSNGAPNSTSTFDSPGANDFRSTPSLGLVNARVGGFENEIDYHLSFLAQDQAGIIMSPTGTCSMGPVQTARILGFLPTNEKKCFIATATFKSSESAPVLMLREFRDEFLLQYSLGKAFVNWYYSWSPGAADWLNEHPIFRFSSLLILFPIEGLAWLILHPMVFMAFFGASCLMVIFAVSLRLMKKEGTFDNG